MADRSYGNYSSCCRLCLSEKLVSLKSIFDASLDSRVLGQKIFTFLGIEINQSDKLSTMICTQCLGKINGWFYFKKTCSDNQTKLLSWLHSWESCNDNNTSIQIKDEIIDAEDERDMEVISDDETRQVKVENEEPMDMHYEDLPPPLTPHPPQHFDPLSDGDDDASRTNLLIPYKEIPEEDTGSQNDSRVCKICDKLFSRVANRKKHERVVHGLKSKSNLDLDDSVNDDDSSQQSVESRGSASQDSMALMALHEVDSRKIEFAATLRLQQRTPTQNTTESSSLTKSELCYIEKCKLVSKMLNTMICTCHAMEHVTVKTLFRHLRDQGMYIPIFTCFICLITYTDRSTSARHRVKCTRLQSDKILEVTKFQKQSPLKIRSYQRFKCVTCKSIFTFMDDFGEHMIVEHCQGSAPFRCSCPQQFDKVDEFKEHLQTVCLVHHFCDICFEVFPTLQAFRRHCEVNHDNCENVTIFNVQQNEKGKFIASNRMLEANGSNYSTRSTAVLNRSSTSLNSSEAPYYAQPTRCTICKKLYSSYHNMLRHFKTHDPSQKALRCEHCHEKFRLVTQLKEHLTDIHGIQDTNDSSNYKFSCPDCGDLFETLEQWTEHKETHPKKKCSECEREFTLQTELDQHRSVHLNLKVYRDTKTQDYKSAVIGMLMCEICDKAFDSRSELRQHKLLHEKMPILIPQEDSDDEGDKKYSKYHCTICNKDYARYSGLWNHNKKHHPGKHTSKQFQEECKYCDRILYSSSAAAMHKQMHERLTQQELMSRIRKNSPRFKRTMVADGTDDDDDSESYHTCDKCFKVFASRSNLRSHMKSHGIMLGLSRTRGNKIFCNVCHQVCNGFEELEEHKREHLTEDMPELPNQVVEVEDDKMQVFTCDLCTKIFNSRIALKKHKERHEQEQNFVLNKTVFYCKYCKVSFSNEKGLAIHMKEEHQVLPKLKAKTEQTKFYCSICKKVFNTMGSLSTHQGWHKRTSKTSKHMKLQEKLYQKMQDKANKSEHGVQNFGCYSCSASFPTDTALQIHILEVHRNINATVLPARCNTCHIEFESQISYERHMQLHFMSDKQQKDSGLKIFRCQYCDRIFEKLCALSMHVKVHTRQRQEVRTATVAPPSKPNKFYSCSICNVMFPNAKELRTHVFSQHPF